MCIRDSHDVGNVVFPNATHGAFRDIAFGGVEPYGWEYAKDQCDYG